MNMPSSSFLPVRLLLTFLAGLAPPGSLAQVPVQVHYQGRLLDGTNLVNGSIGLSLRFFASPVGGALLYEDSNVVAVSDSLYSTVLGDHTVAGSLIDALTNAEVWLEVAANGTVLSPRERIAAVAYALTTRGWGITTNQPPSIVGNPDRNSAAASGSFIGGGAENVVSGNYATISGGWTNLASGLYSTVGGGERNVAAGESATVVGGRFNTAAGTIAIAGGEGNYAGDYAIALGLDNRALSYASGIFSGDDNVITGTEYSVIVGGQLNRILDSTEYSAVVGGFHNTVGPNAQYAFAAGRRAHAAHPGSFVWADSTDADFATTTSNQFLIRASGGVGINRATTDHALEVAGDAGKTTGGNVWQIISDRNAKESIEDLQAPLETILQLQPVRYRYRDAYRAAHPEVPAREYHGFVAQDFRKVFPDDVTWNEGEGLLQMDASAVVPYLVGAVQELSRRNAALEQRLAERERAQPAP